MSTYRPSKNYYFRSRVLVYKYYKPILYLTWLGKYDMIDIMDITQEIEKWCNYYHDTFGLTTRKINNGNCGDFACNIELNGFGVAVWGDEDWLNWSFGIKDYPDWFTHIAPYHCFIWHESKYYDSECPEGCDYADQLPFYQRQKFIIDTEHRLAKVTK